MSLPRHRNRRKRSRWHCINLQPGDLIPSKASSLAANQIGAALAQIDALTEGAAFVVGHNVVRHDLPTLAKLFPDLLLNRLPAVDTLELSPLAFPANPYHSLVKDYKLVRDSRSDPLKDAQLSFKLWADQHEAFTALQQSSPDELACHHFFLSRAGRSGLGSFFANIREHMPPKEDEIRRLLPALLLNKVCPNHLPQVLDEALADSEAGRAFSYVLAWLRVSGGNSVLPPWVRLQFPSTSRQIRQLRESPCGDAALPVLLALSRPLQGTGALFRLRRLSPRAEKPERRFAAGRHRPRRLRGESLLAILPTGGGKSICYQLPALSRHWRNGSLTIIISPLQSLMKDQVDNLIKVGIYNSATLNGMLTMPERRDVLDKVRLGDIGILLVSPEQFRNRAFVEAIRLRQIGAWVFDEAHCLSKWGNDFRPDYLYVSRFIRERYARNGEEMAPVSCFTATAKQEVVEDICAHFQESLGLSLRILDGGHERENLHYEVISVGKAEKNPLIHRLLEKEFGPARSAPQLGGAVIFAGKRGRTEEISGFLKDMGWALRPLSRRAGSRA
jgi:ATP-dependent DNA helicase RecQ